MADELLAGLHEHVYYMEALPVTFLVHVTITRLYVFYEFRNLSEVTHCYFNVIVLSIDDAVFMSDAKHGSHR